MTDPGTRALSLATRVLRAALPSSRRTEVLDDLSERYARRAGEGGRSDADRWYLRQCWTLAWWAIGERVLEARAGSGGHRWGNVWNGAAADVRVGVRSLMRNPGYAAVGVLTLALGIGGNTAVFSVVDGVLLRPLPFEDSHELVAIHETRAGQSWWSAAPVNVVAWRERSRALEDVAWGQTRRASLIQPDGEPEAIRVAAVSANMMRLLGVRPAHGRLFRDGEDQRGAGPVALLTHDVWTARFGRDRAILGAALDLDGLPHTVVGILPPGREPAFLGRHEVLVPRIFTESEIQTRGRILRTIGRRSEAADFEAADREIGALATELDEAAPGGSARGWGARLVPLKEEMVGPARAPLLVLLGAVGFVLLVACANLSNLMLARGSARAADLAVRASMGASRARLVRHLLAEAALVALLGGVVGLGLAAWGTGALLRIDPSALPRLAEVGLDRRVLGFTAITSVLAAGLFGLIPAMRVSHVDVASAFQARGVRGGTGRSESRLRAGLVSAEVALVVMLLVGAGMMLRGVQALGDVDPGFEATERVAVRFSLTAQRFPDAASMASFVAELTERVDAIPGVLASGTVTTLPLSGGPGYTSFHVLRSLPTPEAGGEPIGGMEIVGPGYFEAMGIPVVAGRAFARADLNPDLPVAVIDEAAVERLMPAVDPLSDAVRIAPPGAGAPAAWREIVGVVGPVRYGLDTDPRPRLYLPEGHVGFSLPARTLVVRVRPGSSDAVLTAVRGAFRDVDPLLPIERIERLEDVARTSTARSRFQSTLLAIFAGMALSLGAVGVYGVVAYTVTRRTREVGVRLALGASRGAVLSDVVRRALTPVLIGLGLGLAAAAALSGLLSSLVFGVDALDPVAFGGAPALLFLVALLAVSVPAVRASRVSPVTALRQD